MSKLADKGNWDEDFKDKEGAEGDKKEERKVPYMVMGEGTHRVRLIGPHVKYLQYWNPFSVRTHKDYKNDDPAWQAGFYPNTRYAIHVIDRADGKLKMLDKGKTVFEKFGGFKSLHNIDPAGKDAPDFFIIVKIPVNKKTGKKDKRDTEYSVDAARENSPLTPQEIETYKKDRINLSELYKAATLEKIKELWDALPEEKRIPPKREKSEGFQKKEAAKPEPEKVEEKMTGAPADKEPAQTETKSSGGDDSTELF